jgi:hypothetical protein
LEIQVRRLKLAVSSPFYLEAHRRLPKESATERILKPDKDLGRLRLANFKIAYEKFVAVKLPTFCPGIAVVLGIDPCSRGGKKEQSSSDHSHLLSLADFIGR